MALKRLNAEHWRAIEELVKPKGERKTITEIAEICGVHRSTIYEWKKDPLFDAEFKKAVVRGTHDRLPDLLDALTTHAIKDGNAAAAKLILTANDMLTNKVEVNDTSRENGTNIDIAGLQARLAAIRGEDDGE